MTAGARRYGRWCREHLGTTLPVDPAGQGVAESLPEAEDVQVPREDATAENAVAE
jgi:hypothetical protein